MQSYFNDSPIENEGDDQYGIVPFAAAIAKSILQMDDPIGTTIAINGEWGSGKSSAVNLIRSELTKSGSEELTVIDFKCWWYRGEEALTLAFFQELNRALQDGLGAKVKGLIPEIGRKILQAGPVIGTAVSLASTAGWGALASGSASFIKRFFADTEALEKTFKKLSKVLADADRRFLVIIDDIDRLAPDEALAIFRLLKSVGRLPNIMYLVVFDRALADKAVEERYPSEGPHYLEKIIQASFEIPVPSQTDLNNAMLALSAEIFGSEDEQHIVRFMNLFYDVTAPYLKTPRHVTRLVNAISVTWPAVSGDVSRGDFLALETLRLYEPELYRAIRKEREFVTSSGRTDKQRHDAKFSTFLAVVPEGDHERIKIVLQRLFPAFENTSYGDGFGARWNAERRVCIAKHFDTYFRLSLSEETISAADLSELLKNAGNREFIEQRFHEAVGQRRKNGRTMVPVLLDELTSHAKRVDHDDVGPLICTMFRLIDELRIPGDVEPGFPSADAHLRLHWLMRRLTEDRFNLAERSELYLKASDTASFEWLIDFVSSAVGDYKGRTDGPQSEDLCLTNADALPTLTARAVNALKSAATDGSLIASDRLVYMLYRWRDLSEDDGVEMKLWLTEQLQHDDTLVALAKALTGESWSTSMGIHGLGDRVSKRHTIAQIRSDFDLFDVTQFRAELDRIVAENKLAPDDIRAVEIFLCAWDKKGGAYDDD
jgi:predicted KAP-like P-loop ATPase